MSEGASEVASGVHQPMARGASRTRRGAIVAIASVLALAATLVVGLGAARPHPSLAAWARTYQVPEVRQLDAQLDAADRLLPRAGSSTSVLRRRFERLCRRVRADTRADLRAPSAPDRAIRRSWRAEVRATGGFFDEACKVLRTTGTGSSGAGSALVGRMIADYQQALEDQVQLAVRARSLGLVLVEGPTP